jgi:hypothetical protein
VSETPIYDMLCNGATKRPDAHSPNATAAPAPRHGVGAGKPGDFTYKAGHRPGRHSAHGDTGSR